MLTVTIINDDLSETKIEVTGVKHIWFSYGRNPEVYIETEEHQPQLNHYAQMHSWLGNVYAIPQDDVEDIQLHS